MERLGITSSEEIYQRITKVEKILFEQINILKDNTPDQYKKFSKASDQKKLDKYCHYHMTRTHSSEECKVLERKNQREKGTKNSKEKTFMIQEA